MRKALRILLVLLGTWITGALCYVLCNVPMHEYKLRHYLRFAASLPHERVLLGVFLWVGIASVFMAVLRRPWHSTLLTVALAVTLSSINIVKLKEAHQVLVPADLYFVSQAWILRRYVPPLGWLAAAAAFLGLLAFVRSLMRTPPGRATRHWVTLSLLSGQILLQVIAVAGLTGAAPALQPMMKSAFDLSHMHWAPRDATRENGLLLALIGAWHSSTLDRPPGLNLDSSKALLAATPPADGKRYIPGGEGPRRVVAVMLESWMDPAWLNFHYNQDPIPNFHALARQGKEIRLVAPVTAGGTANAEFEALTGLSLAAFPPESFPYFHFIRRPVRSVVAELAKAGFDTVAVHNFTREFWQRNLVYPLLGFRRFIAQDDMHPVDMYLNWPSDRYLYEAVLHELEEPKMKFIFAVSVMTHSPYDGSLADEAKTIRIVDGPETKDLVPQLREAYEVYLNKLYEADRNLGDFLKKLEDVPNTSLVVFGDHQPSVTGYSEDRVLIDPATDGLVKEHPNLVNARLYLVPAIVRVAKGESVPELELPLMSTNCLGPMFLEVADVPPPPQYAYLDAHCRRNPLTHINPVVNDGKMVGAHYRNLAFDLIFNSQKL